MAINLPAAVFVLGNGEKSLAMTINTPNFTRFATKATLLADCRPAKVRRPFAPLVRNEGVIQCKHRLP
jgi:hypothetical protein